MLNSEWEDGMEKGLVVISVTDEKEELVDQYMKEMNVTHPVVILPDGALEKVIGVSGFPTSGVFFDNELQWSGHPSSSHGAVEKAMKGATKGGPYPKKLSKAFKLMDQGRAIDAMAELEKVTPKLDEKDAAWAGRYKAYLMDQGAKAFAKATESIDQGFYFRATQLVDPYLGKVSPYDGAAEMEQRLLMLQEEKNYKKEISGGKLYAEAKELEGAKEYLEAVKTYRSAMKKGKGAKIEAHAYDAARALIEARKPGFKSSCERCDYKSQAACSKHYEEVKL
jgi:hypothetical protein